MVHGETPVMEDEQGNDPFAYPKSQGKFITVDSGNDMTTEKIVERIIRNRLHFEMRNSNKEKKELELIKVLEEKGSLITKL